jgi:N12 class adenine-specific DNA methylase
MSTPPRTLPADFSGWDEEVKPKAKAEIPQTLPADFDGFDAPTQLEADTDIARITNPAQAGLPKPVISPGRLDLGPAPTNQAERLFREQREQRGAPLVPGKRKVTVGVDTPQVQPVPDTATLDRPSQAPVITPTLEEAAVTYQSPQLQGKPEAPVQRSEYEDRTRLNQLRSVAAAKLKEIEGALPGIGALSMLPPGFLGGDPTGKDPQSVVLEEAYKLWKEVGSRDPESTGLLKGVSRSAKTNPSSVTPFLASIMDARRLGLAYAISRKEAMGQQLTPAESQFLDAYSAAVASEESFNPGIWDNIGSGAAESAKYIGEFAATSGLGEIAAAPVDAAVAKAAHRAIGSRAARWVARETMQATAENAGRGAGREAVLRAGQQLLKVPGMAASGAAQAAANVPGVAAGTLENLMPKFNVSVDDKNQLVRAFDRQGDGLLKSIAKAYGKQIVEFGSERAGGIVEEPLTILKSRLIDAWLAKKGFTSIQQALEFSKNIPGWNGLLGETFEELAGQPFQNLIEGQGPFEQGFSLEEIAQTLGTVGLIGAVGGSAGAVQQGKERAGQGGRIRERAEQAIERPDVEGALAQKSLQNASNPAEIPPKSLQHPDVPGGRVVAIDADTGLPVVKRGDLPKLTTPQAQTTETAAPPQPELTIPPESAPNVAPNSAPNSTPNDRYAEAVQFVKEHGKPSTALLQNRMRIGYGDAVRYIDRMRAEGLIPPAEAPQASTPDPELRNYAQSVVSGGRVKSVELVGSQAAKGGGNDTDIIYDFGQVGLPADEVGAVEALEALIESTPNLDTEKYDTFIKADGRYFHLSSGAGRGLVENNEYAKQQNGRPRVLLSSGAATPASTPQTPPAEPAAAQKPAAPQSAQVEATPEPSGPPPVIPRGHWLNRMDIDEAVDRHKNHPVLAKATKFLSDFRDEVDDHSDGWPHWKLPGHAAQKLMDLIQHPELATEEGLRAALGPIKAFYTKHGNAAGMKMPEIQLAQPPKKAKVPSILKPAEQVSAPTGPTAPQKPQFNEGQPVRWTDKSGNVRHGQIVDVDERSATVERYVGAGSRQLSGQVENVKVENLQAFEQPGAQPAKPKVPSILRFGKNAEVSEQPFNLEHSPDILPPKKLFENARAKGMDALSAFEHAAALRDSSLKDFQQRGLMDRVLDRDDFKDAELPELVDAVRKYIEEDDDAELPMFRNALRAMTGEGTIPSVPPERGAGQQPTEQTPKPAGGQVIAIRRGEVSSDGAHFSLPGSSTYYDEDAVESGEAQKFDLSSANIADTTDPKVVTAILEEAQKIEMMGAERVRVLDLLKEARNGEPHINYLDNEELPLPEAAKRLGYDGIKVWENDDITGPSSVFVWNTAKAKQLKSETSPAPAAGADVPATLPADFAEFDEPEKYEPQIGDLVEHNGKRYKVKLIAQSDSRMRLIDMQEGIVAPGFFYPNDVKLVERREPASKEPVYQIPAARWDGLFAEAYNKAAEEAGFDDVHLTRGEVTRLREELEKQGERFDTESAGRRARDLVRQKLLGIQPPASNNLTPAVENGSRIAASNEQPVQTRSDTADQAARDDSSRTAEGPAVSESPRESGDASASVPTEGDEAAREPEQTPASIAAADAGVLGPIEGTAPSGDDTRPGAGSSVSGDDTGTRRNGRQPKVSGDVTTAADGKPVETSAPETPAQATKTIAEIRNKRNYKIPDDVAPEIGSGGEKTKIRANLDSIELLKKLMEEGRVPTPEEQKQLARYVDFGGLRAMFDRRWEFDKENDRLEKLLTPEEIAAIKETSLNTHYTALPVVDQMWKAVKRLGFSGGTILEPGMGIGNFFGRIPGDLSKRSSLIGIEKNIVSGQMASMLYPDAKIIIRPYEQVTMPNDSVDMIIGNPPFADIKIFDPLYTKPKFSIHNYFIVKSLDKLKPGGVAALITSHYTMDGNASGSIAAREAMFERADLIGAIRLPGDAFKKNAGTDVTTDILFFRKRLPGEQPSQKNSFLAAPAMEIGNASASVNEYFHEHPEMVLGENSLQGSMYSKGEYTVKSNGDTIAQLAEAIKKLPKDVTGAKSAAVPDVNLNAGFADGPNLAPQEVKDNAFYVDEKGSVKIKQKGASVELPEELNKPPVIKHLKDAIELRDALKTVLSEQMSGASDAELKRSQGELNKLYDKYRQKYGPLTGPKTARVFQEDPEYPLLTALENIDPESKAISKADIFSRRTTRPYEPLRDLPEDPRAAMLKVLAEKGSLDLPLMSRLMKRPQADVEKNLLEAGLIFRDPVSGAFSTADAYLSGNVRVKLKQAQAAAEIDEEFQSNVKALEKVQPEPLKIEEIEVRLGQTWIPGDIYAAFMEHLAGRRSYYDRPTISRDLQGRWAIEMPAEIKRTHEILHTWGAGGLDAIDLVEHALNLQQPTIYYPPDKDGHRELNAEATQAARAKLQEIKDEFSKWVVGDQVRPQHKKLEEIYNDAMNGLRRREFDGSHLEFPGLSPVYVPRNYQANAAWRIIQEGRALLAHDVGTGKTLTMMISGMELKRIGLSRKNLYVVPNNMVPQWREDFKKAYPGANVLAVTDKDLSSAKHRRRLMSRIATNDWDAVIVPHSQFNMLPISPERETKTLKGQLREVDEILDELKKKKGGKKKGSRSEERTLRQIENARQKVEQRLRELSSGRKDNTVYFDDLGIDQLFIDEAHAYKALPFYTKMGNIAGLSNRKSQRAQNVLAKIEYMYDSHNGRGVVFATGTPITNTMGENYLMTKYIAPDVLERAGIRHFDDWAANFATAVVRMEHSVDGVTVRPKASLSEFLNVPELQQMWSVFADVVTQEEALKSGTYKVPKARRKDVLVKVTPAQEPYLLEIAKRGERLQGFETRTDPETGKEIKVSVNRPDPKDDNWLKLDGDSRDVSLDVRFVDPSADDHPDSKANNAVRETKRILDETAKQRGTVLIIADRYAKSDGKFNIFKDIKEKLIKQGVPAKEIAIVHDYPKRDDFMAMQNAVREGKIRVVLGTTERMGIGVNIQTRLKGLLHLDLPQRPDQVEQREGRIIRHGNTWDEVEVIRFISEPRDVNSPKAHDLQRAQLLERKQTFLTQFKSGKLRGRKIEDLAGDVRLSPQMFAIAKAAATGNPYAMEKIKIEYELKGLVLLNRNNEFEKRQLKWDLERYQKQAEEARRYIPLSEAVVKAWKENETRDDAGKLISFKLSIDGKEFTTSKDANEYLKDNPLVTDDTALVVNGVTVPLRIRYIKFLSVGEVEAVEYRLGGTWWDAPIPEVKGTRTSAQSVVTSVLMRGRNYEQQVKDWKHKLADAEERLPKIKADLAKPSPYDEKIAKYQQRLQEIDNQILGKVKEVDELADAQAEPEEAAPEKDVEPDENEDIDEDLEERQAGPNIFAAIRQADRLNIPRGSFTVERTKKRDYTAVDRVLTPLSLLDFQGAYERIGGTLGKEASDAIRSAKFNIQELTHRWGTELDKIIEFSERDRKARRMKRKHYDAEFVRLIEKRFDDNSRRGITADQQKALELHDAMTEEFRDFIIESRRALGIETPDDWGITEQGYYRHLFLGDIRLFVDGNFVGVAQTYVEAQKKAMEILEQNPNAQITAKAREMHMGDPTVRVTSGKYERVVNQIQKDIQLTREEIVSDLRGVIGKNRNKNKFFGALIQRKGVEGYSRDYRKVMELHAAQVARTQELTRLNRKLQGTVEKIRKTGQPGLADAIQRHLDTLWGTPSKAEQDFGRFLESIPVLRNHIANPALVLRATAARITAAQSFLKLQYNLRSSLVNLLDPLRTLWPYTSTREFASLYSEYLKPSTRAMLRARGVVQGTTKLEGDLPVIGHVNKSPFARASQVNRAIGYLYGMRQAKIQGLTSTEAHRFATDWADKVEFDNSAWNAPEILRSPLGRVLGQFKGYSIKTYENLVKNVAGKREGEGKIPRFMRMGKWATGQAVVGGVKSTGAIAKYGLGGYLLVAALKEAFKYYGMGDDDAKKAAEAVFYGAPSLIGLDLSASIGILEEPYGHSTAEKTLNFFGGPTVSTVVGVTDKVLKADDRGDYWRVARSITPYAKSAEAIWGLAKDGTADVRLDNRKAGVTTFESVMQVLGFTPLKQSRYYDQKEAREIKRDKSFLTAIPRKMYAPPSKRKKVPSFFDRMRTKPLSSAEKQ